MPRDIKRRQEARLADAHLVQIVSTIQVSAALTYIPDLSHEMAGQFALNREVPFVDGWVLQVLIKRSNTRRQIKGLGGRRKRLRWSCGGWRYRGRESLRNPVGGASRRNATRWRRCHSASAQAVIAVQDEPWNFAGDGGDLEG